MADKKVNLRQSGRFRFLGSDKEPSAGAPPPKTNDVNLPNLKGTIPFAPGIIDKKSNTPAGVLQEEKRIMDAPIITPTAEKKKAAKLPEIVKIEELPEAQQKEILTGAKAAMANDQFIPTGPGVGAAYAQARKVAAEVEEKLSKPSKPSVTDSKPADVPGILTDTGEAQTPCVHCGWPVNSKDKCNPSLLDKQVFVAAVLGQNRFMKDYSLLGGQLRVTFRALTVDESDVVIQQLVQDWNDAKISGPAHSVAEATKYQMTLALASIETNAGTVTLPTYEEYECDTPQKGTNLPEIVTYVTKTTLTSEPLRRIIAKTFGHFLDTTSKLEAMAETPDFWQATEDSH